MTIDSHFAAHRRHIIGLDTVLDTPVGKKNLLYADWIASGRLYQPIEEFLTHTVGATFANTHTESNSTGALTTHYYHEARSIIKEHVGANEEDFLLLDGSGMTGVITRFQRLLGLKVPEYLSGTLPAEERPVVFITHMEHHSNQTSWLCCECDVVVVPPDENGLVCPEQLRKAIEPYQGRFCKIGSFTACSNVTGIFTPYHELARVMHEAGGICLIDFSASAPYVEINMHPADPMERLDAVVFSPHKFLGGPGTCGVLVLNRALYHNQIPDRPGGGTVVWTNPWGGFRFYDDAEVREDGGTPPILQAIQTALAIQLKEQLQPALMLQREHELLERFWKQVEFIPGLHILDTHHRHNRLSIFSFYHEKIHHNLFVRLLNDHFGIQVRSGCSCAGTYGHYLLNIDPDTSHRITDAIDRGELDQKPGWVRVSFHPTMTEEEVDAIAHAITWIVENLDTLAEDYTYMKEQNDFTHRAAGAPLTPLRQSWNQHIENELRPVSKWGNWFR